jgi:glutaryl-CoA dehydrogenase (non-decarboxylating)
MIDFELTDDHRALVQTVREFAQKEVAPFIKEWDEKQQFEPSVLKKMASLNLLGVCIPEEYGGPALITSHLVSFARNWRR